MKPTPQQVEAMDRFNAAMNQLIQAAEKSGLPDLALELARLKFETNQRFYKQRLRTAEDEQYLVSPI